MAEDEKNPMLEAGRATGEHPFEERYALEREIQLTGAKKPEEFMVGKRSLADIQKANQGRQEKEGAAQTERFRESMREQSFLTTSSTPKLVMDEQGIIIDQAEPKAPEGVDKSHQQANTQTQSQGSENKQGPDTTDRTGGPGGQTGAGSGGPGGTNTSGVTGSTGQQSGGTPGGSSSGGTT